MILQRYLARKFLWSFTIVAGVFVVLLTLIDLVDELQDFPNLPFFDVLEIVLWNIPEENYDILPLVVVLTTVSLYVQLARSSELVVIRAAGRSAIRSLIAPVLAAGVIGCLGVTIINPLVAVASKRHTDAVNLHEGGGSSVLVIASEGLWLRQGSKDGQTVIHAERASSDMNVLFDASFLKYTPDGRPEQRIQAKAARLQDGEWLMYDAKIWNLLDQQNPETTARREEQFAMDSHLTQDRIVDSFGKPELTSIWDLPEFINELETAGFSARRYDMWYQMELARPLFLMSLVLVAAAFTMRPARTSNTGLSVLTAVMLGFGLHYVRNFAQILGQNGEIPIALAAWAPPAASVMLAAGILLHMEDG